jgi:hypothetical protein
MNRKAVALSGVLFLAAGCSTAPQAPFSGAELDAAMRADIACLADAARKVDDLKSDAGTVAVAIRGMCSATYARERQIAGQNMNPQVRLMFLHGIDERRFEIPTTIVLEQRRQAGG